MTSIDDALELDRAIPDLDWHVFPAGTVHDVFEAPSGGLARVRLGEPDAPRVRAGLGRGRLERGLRPALPAVRRGGLSASSPTTSRGTTGRSRRARQTSIRRASTTTTGCSSTISSPILEDGRTPAHVLGYSFAGLVAELALVERPDLFASLTLMAAPPATGQVFRGVKHIGPISDMPPHRAAGLILWGIRYNLNRTPPLRIAFVRERMAVTGRPVIDDIVGLMMTMPDIADDVAAIGIPKFIAVGEADLWPEEQHRVLRRAHRRGHRRVRDRPRPVRDRAAPARARHAGALRPESRARPGCSVGTPGEAPSLRTERGRR